jgi:hypothetical protein
MSGLAAFRASLYGEQPLFAATLAFIAAQYVYRPSAFVNGSVENALGQNQGAGQTLSLALLEDFSLEETLLAFGEHYRSVLATAQGSYHANIRALLSTGLAGVRFAEAGLTRKT